MKKLIIFCHLVFSSSLIANSKLYNIVDGAYRGDKFLNLITEHFEGIDLSGQVEINRGDEIIKQEKGNCFLKRINRKNFYIKQENIEVIFFKHSDENQYKMNVEGLYNLDNEEVFITKKADQNSLFLEDLNPFNSTYYEGEIEREQNKIISETCGQVKRKNIIKSVEVKYNQRELSIIYNIQCDLLIGTYEIKKFKTTCSIE